MKLWLSNTGFVASDLACYACVHNKMGDSIDDNENNGMDVLHTLCLAVPTGRQWGVESSAASIDTGVCKVRWQATRDLV